MANEIFDAFYVEAEWNVNPARGAFEVIVDGKTIFSKLKEKRFPEDDEVVPLIEKALAK